MSPNPVTEGCREARALRRRLEYSREQALNPLRVAEQLGIVVVTRPLAERKISGAYLYRPAEQLSFILINASDRLSRRRFTLAHEIGHFVFDRESVVIDDDLDPVQSHSNPERRANAFAAELLLPEAAVKVWKPAVPWGESPDEVAELGGAYGLSYEATLYRLKNAGLIEAVEPLREQFGIVSAELRAKLAARGDEVTQFSDKVRELTDAALKNSLISKKRYEQLREDLAAGPSF